jgi:hypothetical protein
MVARNRQAGRCWPRRRPSTSPPPSPPRSPQPSASAGRPWTASSSQCGRNCSPAQPATEYNDCRASGALAAETRESGRTRRRAPAPTNAQIRAPECLSGARLLRRRPRAWLVSCPLPHRLPERAPGRRRRGCSRLVLSRRARDRRSGACIRPIAGAGRPAFRAKRARACCPTNSISWEQSRAGESARCPIQARGPGTLAVR